MGRKERIPVLRDKLISITSSSEIPGGSRELCSVNSRGWKRDVVAEKLSARAAEKLCARASRVKRARVQQNSRRPELIKLSEVVSGRSAIRSCLGFARSAMYHARDTAAPARIEINGGWSSPTRIDLRGGARLKEIEKYRRGVPVRPLTSNRLWRTILD